jgi:hypothetical protein
VKACLVLQRLVGTLRRLLGALATLVNRNIAKAWWFGAVDSLGGSMRQSILISMRWLRVYDGSEEAVACCCRCGDRLLCSLVVGGFRCSRWLVRRLGGGCRLLLSMLLLYDGSDEAVAWLVACTTARRRLSLALAQRRLVGGCRWLAWRRL